MGCRVLGFGVLGIRVLGFGLWVLSFGFGFWVLVKGFRSRGQGLWVSGFECRALSAGF